MIIRRANAFDSQGISRLITILAEKFIVPSLNEEGTNNLLGSLSTEAVAGYIDQGYRYHVAIKESAVGDDAIDSQVVVGVSATRDDVHLYHLFVDEQHQGTGLAGRLWRTARDACLARTNPGYFTVNSSLNAQAVYRRWGFLPVSGLRQGGGVIDVPMRMQWPPPKSLPSIHPVYLPATHSDKAYFRQLNHACYEAVVRRQFGNWEPSLQDANFANKWQEQQFLKIIVDEQLVGGVWVDHHRSYLRLREIQVHPDFQRRGIGEAVVADVVRESEYAGLPLRLHVLHQNKAISLYERFGFSVIEELDTQFVMQRPGSTSPG